MDRKLIINCVGDSVTEGMTMDGHHTAEYGKHPYPAQLFTILTDCGYDVEVNNYGHGGEKVAEIAARCGGAACYLTEDIVVPGDGSVVSLGVQHRAEDGRALDTKLKLYCDGDASDDPFVFFTQMSHDTNPVLIDGNYYEMSVQNENENVIRKKEPDGKDTLIPKGSVLFTANNRCPDVSVFYGGINDNASLTLERFKSIFTKCALASGGKYIVLGSTHPLWEKWSDIKGETNEEKYEYYKRECRKTFGVHFIDLYDEFSRKGVDIALSAGCFADLSEEQICVMREKLSKHIIPAEFTYNGENDNDVHLSKEGYRVVAELIFERMRLLSYIK